MKKILLIEAILLSYSGLVALIPYIPLSVTIFFSLINLLPISRGNDVILNNRISGILAVLFSILFIGQALTGEPVRSIVYLLLTLNTLKIFGEKRAGDYMQILLLNFLILASVTTFTIEPSFLILILVFTVVSINFLVNLSTYETSGEISEIKELIRFSGKIFLASIPLAVLFFLILPRSGSSYFPSSSMYRKVGLSDRIDITNMEKLLKSGKIAFRVRVLKGKLPPLPYWRGITYEIFRRGSWYHRREAVGSFPLNTERILPLPLRGRQIVQEITLEGSAGFLPALDKPMGGKFPFRVFVSRSLVFKTPASGRLKYRVVSVDAKILSDEPPDENYLSVPPSLADTLRKLFKDFEDTPEKMAEKLSLYFRSRFTYSLDFKAPREEDPILYFLTKGKTGHCEIFASSMALILRSFGIPTRLVGGYLGATYNKIGNYFVVKESDAHSWVEVFIPGMGWERYDPSPPVKKKRRISRLYLYIDYLKLIWYNNVVNYDLFSQLETLGRISRSAGKWKFSRRWLLLLLVFVVPFLRKRRRQHFYVEALKILERKGIKKEPWETAGEFLVRVKREKGDPGKVFEKITRLYEEVEFGGKNLQSPPTELLKRLKKS